MKTKITIKDFFDAVNFQISECFKYGWNCYGPNSYSIGWQEKRNSNWASAGLIYDSENQQVYELSVWDETNNKVYRWINPKFINKVKKEYKERSLNYKNLNYKIAIDNIMYEDLSPARILNRLKKLKEDKNEQAIQKRRNRNTFICKRQKKNKNSK